MEVLGRQLGPGGLRPSKALRNAVRTVTRGRGRPPPSVPPPPIEDCLRLLQVEENSSACPVSGEDLVGIARKTPRPASAPP